MMHGRPYFHLWLRLRLTIVFGEGIWGCSRCNSAKEYFWVVKLDPQTARCPTVKSFLFKIPSNGTLYDFKVFQPVSVSVSFCDSGEELYTKDLVKFLQRWFQDIFFKMAGSGPALGSEDVRSFTVLLSRSKDFVCLFIATELRSCIASFETTGNLETCTFLRWLWICCCVVFACLCFTGLGVIRILSRCWRNGHWMLETSFKVGLQPEGAHYHSETN